MANLLAGHQLSAVTLALAALLALAAELVAGRPGTLTRLPSSGDADLDSFLAPIRHEVAAPRFEPRVASDPLSAGPVNRRSTVAQPGGRPTVSASGRARRLTAILIADDRPVAVLDDIVVGVGDRLPDGSRVDAIQVDRVWVVEKNGQRRLLTLSAGRR